MDYENEGDKKESRVFMLAPDGSIRDISEKASTLRTVVEGAKIDSALFLDALDKSIDELKKE